MSLRTGLVAAVAAAVALACGERGASGPSARSDAPEAAAPPQARAAERPPPDPRSGDRHARAAARRSRVLREVAGTIVRSDERRVAIRPATGPEVTLRLGPRTSFTVAGRRAGPEALRPGVEVRASYRSGEGGPATAVTVDVERAPRERPEEPLFGTDRG